MKRARAIVAQTASLILASLSVGLGASLAAGDRDPAFGSNGELLLVRAQDAQPAPEWLGDLVKLPDGRYLWAMVDNGNAVLVARMHADGSADTSFAGDGRIRIDECVPLPSRPVQIAVDDQGAVMVWTGACLLRLNSDGALDPSFSATGSLPPESLVAADLARDAAGRWLLAGTHSGQFRVWRFLPDGAVDSDFGTDGIATPPIPNLGNGELRAMLLQPGGGMLLAGKHLSGPNNGSQGRALVFRLDDDGQPAADFGSSGVVELTPPPGLASIEAEALLLEHDGHILVAGRGNNSFQSCCALIARLSPDGVLDPGFGLRLLQPPADSTSLGAFGETTSELALLPGRKILLARNSFPFPNLGAGENTRTRFTLIRLHANGEPDTQFGTSGWRDYVVSDPTGTGMSGAYSQFHAMHYSQGKAMMLGRTFFESSNPDNLDFVTLIRVHFERLFADGFEP